MGNVSISAPLVNNSLMDLISHEDSCASAVRHLCGDDTGAPVRHAVIEVTTESGRTVRVVIPNSAGVAVVYIDDDLV